MDNKVKFRDFILPVLLGVTLVLLISSLLYGLYSHFHQDNFPKALTYVILPGLVALAVAYFLVPKIGDRVFFKYPLSNSNSLVLYFILIVASTALFSPLATSLRYNVGEVLYLNNVDEMPAYAQPTFLELGEWYTDRMRVMPINTYERGKFFNRHRVHLRSLYLVPIFAEATAYRTTAKAWLAFKYEKTIPYEEFTKNQGKPHFDESLAHFKKINVNAYLYFEQYRSGRERQVFTNMARIHSYFQSGYANIYEGHTVDRDLISIRYFSYFLIGYFILFIPGLWLIARFLVRVYNPRS